MTDEQTLTLPSGKTAVIRNYTTRLDDEKAENALYIGVVADKNGDINFPIANIMAATGVYVRRLVVSLDGETRNLATQVEELRTADYKALEVAIQLIVDDNSPKAKGGENASDLDTKEI